VQHRVTANLILTSHWTLTSVPNILPLTSTLDLTYSSVQPYNISYIHTWRGAGVRALTTPLLCSILHLSMQHIPSGTFLFLVIFSFCTQLISHCLLNSILFYSMLITHSTIVRYYTFHHMILGLRFTSL